MAGFYCSEFLNNIPLPQKGDGMKRIALLGLACFTLFGCGDDKVTKEYLVGKWECKLDGYSSKMKDGKFTDYVGDGLNITIKEEFKIENNKLYSLKESKMDGYTLGDNSIDWKESDIIDTHTGETIEKIENNSTKKSIKSLLKKSHDTYIVSEEYVTTQNSRIKAEAICTRIK